MATNAAGDLFVVQGTTPQYTEATRAGNGWSVMLATPTAPIAALPTTTARLEIWNPSVGAGSYALVVDTLHAFQLLSTAAVQTYCLFAQVSTVKAIPTVTALTVFSSSGRASFSGALGGRVVTGVDTTVVANGWRPWGDPQSWSTAAATPGNGWHAEVNGRLIVPPGASLQICAVGSIATASSFHIGASWYEVPLTMVS